MREVIVSKALNIIKKDNPDFSNEKMEILEYGLTGFYMFISKSIIIFSVAYFLGILKELVIFMLIYTAIRSVSFGMHASSSMACLIGSSLTFLSVTFVCKIVILPIWFKILLGLITILLVVKYSPADTEKRPIISPKRRLVYKVLSTMVSVMMVLCSFLIKNTFISNSMICALIIQSVMISPITYKLAGQQYDNYKYYKKD
ncbi:MAG: accessory gene regulator B family protein [Bacilli bacterium]|nr:accessory gene regulator B family protein [Bacilli bacterium]